MASRPTFKPAYVITNGDMSGNLTSAVTVISPLSMMSYQVSWTGSTPVGTVSVQCSNDYALNPASGVANAGTWTTIYVQYQGVPVTTVPISGNSGNGIIDIDEIGMYAIRLIYTAGSGTGTMNAIFNAKVA